MKETTRTVKALIFSDVKGFSKMSERDCLLFCRHFHSGVQSDVLSRYADSIILQNTWGDALHVVMDDLTKAGNLALDLRDWMAQHDWIGDGLSADLKIRIALHAGVVTKVPDPIIKAFNYIGRNTSKAARIEPITFEGQVFVSGAYAALLSLERDTNLTCDYVGTRELPKNAGPLAVYLLHRQLKETVK